MKKDTKNEIKDNELDKISGGYAAQYQTPDLQTEDCPHRLEWF